MTTPASDETERLCAKMREYATLIRGAGIPCSSEFASELDATADKMRALQAKLDYWQHKRTFLENAEIAELQADNERQRRRIDELKTYLRGVSRQIEQVVRCDDE